MPKLRSTVNLVVSTWEPDSQLPMFKLESVQIGGGDVLDRVRYLTSLLRLPTKATSGYTTLSEVMAPSTISGSVVDLVVAIRAVGRVRKFQVRSNGVEDTYEERRLREVKVFDQTCPCVVLKLWEEDLVELSEEWIPKQDLLFLADARVDYDDYRKRNVVTVTSRTLVSFNPDTDETRALAEYAAQANFSAGAMLEDAVRCNTVSWS